MSLIAVITILYRQMSALSEFMTFIKDYLPLETGTVNKLKQFQSDSGNKKDEGDTITSDDQEKTSLGISEPSAKGAKPKVKLEEKTDIPRELIETKFWGQIEASCGLKLETLNSA